MCTVGLISLFNWSQFLEDTTCIMFFCQVLLNPQHVEKCKLVKLY